MDNFLQREKFDRLRFIYGLLGPLKGMFWLSVGLMFFAAAWEGVILATAATMFQALVDTTKFSSSTFAPDSLMGSLYIYFLQIPEEYRVIAGFTFTALSVLMGSVINTSLSTFQTSFSTRYIIHVRCKIFNQLYRSSLTYFDNQKKGALLTMVINESRACYSILKNLLQLVISFLKTIVLFSALIAISLELTGVVVIISFMFFAQTYMVARILKRLSVISVEKTRALTVNADESLQGVRLVKLFNLYAIMESSFRENCTIADFTNRKQSLIIQWQGVLANFLMIISILILIFLNINFSFAAISLMLTFLYTLQKLNVSLTAVNKTFGSFNKLIPLLDRIMDFFNWYDVNVEKSGNLVREKLLDQKLSFQGVNLCYSPIGSDHNKVKRNSENVLTNIDLDIHKGGTIALVGESGSGKTSLANLIVRLYDPTKGRILIDGVDIIDFDLIFLRERVGLVNQDTVLFNKSIRENIMFGRENASEDEMIVAAEKAHVHEFVTQMPKGYQTLIGDKGVKLSGGQRQRLNIAQVFLKNPEIMILDEATSSLDTKSEQYIQESIKEISAGCTNIIIAHRLSTIRNADKVVVLDKGEIIEEGAWNSLMEAKGVFNDMVKRQLFVEKST
tara:strand:- start:1068 stop:2924 length:1857 start_codon:yes stop_codon:yes gene_type:complete